MASRLATQSFHKNWLLVTAIGIAAFGPFAALASRPEMSEPARWALDLLSWPLDGSITYQPQEMRFLSAITGGVLFGWGVMIWALRAWVYDVAPEGVRKSVVFSLLGWFVLDSLGSVLSGTTPNAVFNIAFLILLIGPLWRPAQS
ncbi:MAG: hypothetical protein JJ908_11640 [Rhizobiales bacterium]|nr:hypothetical protein [Hyphomicrobiales bacterium]MBO6699476.1 hypothetical protein [Hyphomicrobiales bacterium]MBO6737014.1 hypothetical protein [Hyphomicrobiales bacterium]MBO6911912.1 hypothetical protein [Hyphomicrobiales bacterium]MBO6956881.1 hypothetical protein [Hyphomicrobiales bacterium]